ncbi:hypothetical protein WUBG_04452, partial [Wuchereria bancrofti]
MNGNNESSSASSTCDGGHASINSPANVLSKMRGTERSTSLVHLFRNIELSGKHHNSFHSTIKPTNKATENWIRKKEKYVADLAILHNSPKCRTNCVILHNVSFRFALHMITLKNNSLRHLFIGYNDSQLSEGLAQWLNGTIETAKTFLNGNSENSIHIFATDQTRCSVEIIW